MSTSLVVQHVGQEMLEEAIEPWQLFVLNYRKTNQQIVEDGKNILSQMEQRRQKLADLHEKYLHTANKSHKNQGEIEHYFRNFNSKDTDKISQDIVLKMNKTAKLKSKVDDCYVDYKNQHITTNRAWEKFDSDFTRIFESFDLNEESRQHFTKTTVQQLVRHLTNFFLQFNQNLSESSKEKYEQQLRLLPDKAGEQNKTLKRIQRGRKLNILALEKKEEFVSFEEWVKVRESENANVCSDELQLMKFRQIYEENLDELLFYFKNIIEGRGGDTLQQLRNRCVRYELQMIFKESAWRLNFLKTLAAAIENTENAQSNLQPLASQDFDAALRILLALTYEIEIERHQDVEEFYLLLCCLVALHKNDRKARLCIGQFISAQSTIFFDGERWLELMQYMVQRQQQNSGSPSPVRGGNGKAGDSKNKKGGGGSGSKSGNNSIFKKSLKMFKEAFTNFNLQEENTGATNEQGKQQGERKARMHNIVTYNTNMEMLEEISNFMLKIHLKVEIASEIILLLAGKNQIRINDITNLLEIQENRTFFESGDYERQRVIAVNLKLEKKLRRLNSHTLFAVLKSLDFLYDGSAQTECLPLLLVCKQWNAVLTPKLQKRCILDVHQNLSANAHAKRLALYSSILKVRQFRLSLEKIQNEYDQVQSLDEKQKQVEELIRLDVQRSFQNKAGLIDHGELFFLLRMYSFYAPHIGYCQGMNFLMGFLHMLIRNKEQTFKVFALVIERLLHRILQNDLDYVKVLFYKLDRLIQLHFPKIAEHFQNIKIEAGHYAAPWFLTLFTNSCHTYGYGEVVFEIWDIVLMQGWKGMFKIVLAILRRYEEIVPTLKFDQCLSFLNNLSRCEFYRSQELMDALRQKEPHFPIELIRRQQPIANFKEEIKTIEISNELLATIEKENFLLRDRIKLTVGKLEAQRKLSSGQTQ